MGRAGRKGHGSLSTERALTMTPQFHAISTYPLFTVTWLKNGKAQENSALIPGYALRFIENNLLSDKAVTKIRVIPHSGIEVSGSLHNRTGIGPLKRFCELFDL